MTRTKANSRISIRNVLPGTILAQKPSKRRPIRVTNSPDCVGIQRIVVQTPTIQRGDFPFDLHVLGLIPADVLSPNGRPQVSLPRIPSCSINKLNARSEFIASQ
jgi:hypothetical protein